MDLHSWNPCWESTVLGMETRAWRNQSSSLTTALCFLKASNLAFLFERNKVQYVQAFLYIHWEKFLNVPLGMCFSSSTCLMPGPSFGTFLERANYNLLHPLLQLADLHGYLIDTVLTVWLLRQSKDQVYTGARVGNTHVECFKHGLEPSVHLCAARCLLR